MEKAIFYNKKFAFCVLFIIMILSVILGGARGLINERNKVKKVFESGALNDGVSVANDIIQRANLGFRLVTIARNYSEYNSTVGEICNRITEISNAIINAKTIEEKFTHNNDMTNAVNELYDVMRDVEMTENHRRSFENSYTETNSRNSTIRHDIYNSMALDFNKLLDEFPALIIKTMGFVKTLPTYSSGNSAGF